MNHWKWSYYCLNHDGICCFFRKLKASFLAVKATMSWKTQIFQPLDVPLYLHVSSLSWTCVTAWNEFFWELLGSGRLFYDSCASGQMSGDSSQHKDTCHSSDMETPRHEWLVVACASCLKAKKSDIFLPGSHQGTSQGAKWNKEAIKCGGCRVSLGSFPHSLCRLWGAAGMSSGGWNISWWLECLLPCWEGTGLAIFLPRLSTLTGTGFHPHHLKWHWLTQNKRFLHYCWAIEGIHRYTQVLFTFYMFCYF